MKYIASIIIIFIILLAGSGCTSVKTVPMITPDEDQLLLVLAKARKGKNTNDRLVIGIVYEKDEELQKYAEGLQTYFEMTDYVKEINYTQDLVDKPDFTIEYIEPFQKTRIPMMVTIPFYALSLGVIPMFTYLEWGYDFTIEPSGREEKYPMTIGYYSYGYSGWLCLLINWLPGWSAYNINGEYDPIEAKCRLILQLQDKKQDILKLRQE